MAVSTEIAPNTYRISIFVQQGNSQFNHFLVKDGGLLLFHTGLRGMHPEIREAVSCPNGICVFHCGHLAWLTNIGVQSRVNRLSVLQAKNESMVR
jgi:hypothetical protein